MSNDKTNGLFVNDISSFSGMCDVKKYLLPFWASIASRYGFISDRPDQVRHSGGGCAHGLHHAI